MTDKVLPILLDALVKYKGNESLQNLGKEMFRMYTEMGFPPDMFLSELGKRQELDMLAKVFIVSEYQTAFLEHRRKSGVEEKRIDTIRDRNRKDLERLIETGELGVY